MGNINQLDMVSNVDLLYTVCSVHILVAETVRKAVKVDLAATGRGTIRLSAGS